MKLALVSDIHANLEALQATLADIARLGVDRVVCLGDLVGYNTHPAECIALVRKVGALCVAGNHDLAVCGRIASKNFSAGATRAVVWTQRHLAADELYFLSGLPLRGNVDNQVLAVHGALHPQTDCATVRLDSEEARMQSFQALAADPSGARICAFGHTHRAGIYEFRRGHARSLPEQSVRLLDDAYYLVNPGTVGQPRGRDRRASYMVLDLAQRTVSLHRVAYDATATLAATRAAGLAPALAFVPAPIRGALGSALHRVGLDRPIRQFAAFLGL